MVISHRIQGHRMEKVAKVGATSRKAKYFLVALSSVEMLICVENFVNFGHVVFEICE